MTPKIDIGDSVVGFKFNMRGHLRIKYEGVCFVRIFGNKMCKHLVLRTYEKALVVTHYSHLHFFMVHRYET